MTFAERNLQIKIEERDAGFERPQDIKRGEVVEVNGSIEGDLPYLVWIRPLETNATPLQMFNPGTIENLQTEMTVFYRQDPGRPAPWSLINFDSSTYAQDASTFLTLPGTNNPPHADDHTMAPGHLGPDPLNIFGHAIADFAVRPNSPASMNVRIFSGWFPGTSDYEFFVGPVDSKDFTADIPASVGKALLIAIAIDSTGTIQYINGTEFVDGDPIPAAAKPVVTTEYLLITAVRLVNGMTSIQNENFDHEMRPVFAPGGLSRAIDGARVSKLISPDGLTDPVLSADNSGDVTLAGTGDMILPDDIIHSGDVDTLISLEPDKILIQAGGVEMISFIETAQDEVVVNDGQVDVDFRVEGNNVADVLFTQASTDRVGIRTTTPTGILDIAFSGATPIAVFGDGLDSAFITFNGSAGKVRDMRYQTAGTNRWSFRTNNTAEGGSDAGSDFEIIAHNDAGAVLSRVFFIKRDTSLVGIQAPSPAAKLHVDQSSASLALPVLLLDQADVSEEMIEYVSTIGVGNAIEAVGAKTLTVTHFIKVTLPGGLTRYHQVGTIA